MLFSGKKPKVHIMIKDHVIRFVVTTQPSLMAIKSYGERYLPPGVIREGKIIERETLFMILLEIVNDYKLRGLNVFFCVPDDHVVIRKMTIPSNIPEDEIKGYIYLEMGETIHLPFDDPQFDFSICNKSDAGTDIIMIASSGKMIEEYADVLKETKLKPVVADISSLSLYRLLEELQILKLNEHMMLIQIDIRSINVTIFHEDIPLFTRHQRLNLDHELWEVVKDDRSHQTLKWMGQIEEIDGQIQEVITELDRMMSFYRFSVNQGRAGVTKILLSGDNPELPRIANLIKAAIEIPVEEIPSSTAKTKTGKELPIRFHEVVGLSLKKQI